MSQSRVLTTLLSFAAALAVAAGLLVAAAPTLAASSLLCSGYGPCDRAGYSHHGYESKQKTSYWRMYTGTNCTNYVAYRLVTTNGMPNTRPKSGVGNARDWGKAMSHVTDSTPTVGSVAWWGKTGNHVAYVERVVSSTEIIVSESNWGRAFDWRRITKSGSGWPDGFIHFDDTVLENTAKPAISGSGRVGEKLSATAGTWKPTPSSFRYEWRADGTVISGATSSTFTPAAAQLGRKLSVRVVATRASFPTAAATSSSRTTTEGVLTPSAAPTVTGTPKVDYTVTATAPATSPAASSTTYQWLADGAPVAKATSSRLMVTPELAGARLSVRTGSVRAGYGTLPLTSSTTKAVAVGTLSSTKAPAVSGRAAVDAVLSASTGTWSRADAVLSYQWFADGTAVKGATQSTYRPRVADAGKKVSVRILARRDGYADASRTSGATAAVTVERFATTARPVVTGTHRVGQRLTASTPTWKPAASTSTYQWSVGGKEVAGATGPTFVLRPEDRRRTVTVAVTGTRSGYAPVRHTSVPTAAVESGSIVAARPRLTGAAIPGRTLGIDLGSVPSGTTHTYQWLLDGKAIPGERGTSHAVTTKELGKTLSVRVGYLREGYTTSTQKSAGADVKALSSLKISTRRTGRDVKVAVHVKAPGVSTPTGTVVVRVGGTSRTLTLADRRVVTTFKAVKAGSHKVSAEYRGSARTRSAKGSAAPVKVP